MWQMNFAPSKCYIMSIALKRQPSSFLNTLWNTPLEGVTFQKYLGLYITNSLNWTKQAVEVKKKANKILGVRSKGTYRLVALLSRNEPICPWSALYASTAPSPGVHIHKKTLSVLNPFSVVRHALFVTITVVPVALIQCYRTWVGKILRHVGRSPI